MKNYILITLITLLITSCAIKKKKYKQNNESRILKTGDIMEMNSDEFLVKNNTWKLTSTEHFKFYFDKSIQQDFQDKIIKSQESNFNKIVHLMGAKTKEFSKINLWIFKNRLQKKTLTLVDSDAHAISSYNSAYQLPKNAVAAQEVGHVMTQSLWGFIPKTNNYALLIDEGFNYFIDDNSFYTESLLESTKKLHQKNPVDITQLINANNGQRTKGVSAGSHKVNESKIAGAFVQYLIKKYGKDKFGQLWKKATLKEYADTIIFKEIYGKTIEELNVDFIITLN